MNAHSEGGADVRLLSASLNKTDPRQGTVTVEVAGRGVLTQTYQWDTPEQARQMMPKAIELALTAPAVREVGEGRHIVRFGTPLGALYLARLTGPPTWRLPKAGVRRAPGYLEVMAGWLRVALVLGWRTPSQDRGTARQAPVESS